MKAALGLFVFLGTVSMFGQVFAQEAEPPLERFTLIATRGELSMPVAVHRQVVGWVMRGEHHHVTVSAHLGNGGGHAYIDAYLMKRIGPGATTGDEIAFASFDLGFPFDDWVDVFADLDLEPGEYWLIIAKPKEKAHSSINWFVFQPKRVGGSCSARFIGSQSFTFQSDAADYLPASKFESKYEPYAFQFEVSDLQPAGWTGCP
jgi:hypothetical protein